MLSRMLSQSGLTGHTAPEPPNEFLCPISLNLLNDPVIASDGHSVSFPKVFLSWFFLMTDRCFCIVFCVYAV